MKRTYLHYLCSIIVSFVCALDTGAQTNEFGYATVPNASSAEPAPVGSPAMAFNITPTGGSTFIIPIDAPKGLPEMEPSISITYNSQSGNGIAGWGCSLSGISVITRVGSDIFHDGQAAGLTHGNDDKFRLDGQRLIDIERIPGSDSAVFVSEADPFTRVVLHGLNGTYQNCWWFRVTDKDGNVFEYGHQTGQQAYHSGQDVNAWYITRTENVLGNYMTYHYTTDWYTLYLSSIVYGNNSLAANALENRIVFEYENRTDVTQFYLDDVPCRMTKRLKNIVTKTGNDVYRTYRLNYDTSSDGIDNPYSRLTTVTMSNGDGAELKPLTIQWDYLPAHSVTVEMPSLNTTLPQGYARHSEKSYATGDVNGDGLTDIIEKGYVRYDETIYQPYEYQYLVPHYAVKDASGNITFQQGALSSVDSNLAIEEDWVDIYHSPSTLDIDGDGKAEVVIPRYFSLFGAKQLAFYVFTDDGVATGARYVLDAADYKYNVGDFNNDGKGEAVVIESYLSGSSYQGGILGFNTVDSVYRKDFLFDVPVFPKDWLVADMNNDGMADVVAFYDGGYTVFWNDGSWLDSPTTVHPSKTSYTLSLPGTVSMVRQGDFNGDGTTDFLIGLVGSGAWYMETGLGNGEFSQSLACTIDGDPTAVSYNNRQIGCMVYDMDGDGKTDAVIVQNKYDIDEDYTQTVATWLRSTGTTLATIRTATSTRAEDGSPQYYMLGDFNGDGLYELADKGFNCYSSNNANEDPQFRIYAHGGYTPSKGKVSGITDGYGNTTNIAYKSLTDAAIYTKGVDGAYPFIDCTIPLTVVSSVTSSSGIAGTQELSYQYEGLKVQLQGRGLAGFTANTVSNQTLGTTVECRVTSWNMNNYSKAETTETHRAGSYTSTSHKRFIYYNPAGQSLYPFLVESQDIDYDGNTTNRYYDYDFGQNGSLLSEECDRYDGRSDLSVNDDYVFRKGRYLPQTVIWSPMYIGRNDGFLSETDYTYDAIGRVSSKTEHAGTTHELSTAYTYDSFGNVLTETITGNGIAAIQKSYTYDATHRFVTEITEQGIHTTFTYDRWGNRLTETLLAQTSTPQTTTYSYDGWNNLTTTLHPDGTKAVMSYGWGTTAGKHYYLLEQRTAVPWVKTWYDARGRKVKTESIGPKDITVCSSVSYNTKGQVSNIFDIYGSLSSTKEYTYDSRGRVLTDVLNSGRTRSYTYGQNSVTCQENGNTSTRTYNADGQVLTATDSGGSVTYVYGAHGNPLSVTSGGQAITMEYDDVANRTKLIDPDAGTQTYSYDALGRIVSQTDARGNTTTYTYNALGQKVSETVGPSTTTYTYHTSGGGTGQLATATLGSQILSYGYDDFGRVSSESRQLSGTSYDYTYQYNQQGLLSSKTYPGSVTEQFTYDSYGNMATQTVNGQTVWQHTSSTGMNNQYALGGGALTRSLTRNRLGLQTQSLTKKNSDGSNLLNMLFGYDTAKGNLSRRSFGLTNIERFTYDNFDRLTAITKSGTSTTVTYSANGNITSKTGIGQYYYDASQPHAVSAVDNTDGMISENTATCSFDKHGRLNTVHDSQANKHVVYTYGPDGNRWSAWKWSPSSFIYYVGDVEITSKIGSKTWFYYLANDVLYVKKTGVADSVYYICRDNIGSIMKITDADGRIAFDALYDPWGHQTVNRNDLGFFRGYTGHEMLPELGLINMNGRTYDPLLGRFLSPDNYVQIPYSSQGFNRYTYCLNNPLKYNDPSGEIPALVVGAIIGGIMNTAMNMDNINNAGQFFKYFSVGAVAGAMGGAAGSYLSSLVGVSGGVIGGATYGFGAGVAGGAISGAGNSYLNNGNFNHVWEDALHDALIGGISGAVAGGIAGGYSAYKDGNNIWTGELKADVGQQWGIHNNNLSSGETGNTQSDILRSNTSADIETKGFKSYNAFKKEYGSAGEGMEWHHIVEQKKMNIDRFGAEKIHNIDNIVPIPREIHRQISSHYSSIQPFSNNMRVRDWLNTKSFVDQYKFGLKTLNKFGILVNK